MEPQVNEVWETLSERLVLIVEVPPLRLVTKSTLGILWYDDSTKNFVVSEILDRLKVKRDDISQAEWFREAIMKVTTKAQRDWIMKVS